MLRDYFCDFPVFIGYFNEDLVEVGILGAPQLWLLHFHHADSLIAIQVGFAGSHSLLLVKQGDLCFSSAFCLQYQLQIRMGEGIVQQGPYPQIPDMDLGNRI